MEKICKLKKCIRGRALIKGKWKNCINCEFERQKNNAVKCIECGEPVSEKESVKNCHSHCRLEI